MVMVWYYIYWFGFSEDQFLFDGFMVVMIQYNDIIICYIGLYNSMVRIGGFDNYGSGVVSIEYVGGVFFVFVKCVGMVEE